MGKRLLEFKAFRERMNDRVIATGTLETRRFFALDGAVYEDGALPASQKEMLGLVASLVLRCDDCVTYHLIECARRGATRAEVVEAMNVGLIVGGSIVIPHLRRAHEVLDELEEEAGA